MFEAAVAKRQCLVCGAPTNYAHLGIDSCRSCADFYKRSLAANKDFSCRQGTHKCSISKNDRFVCRRCRFEKCKALGMSLDAPRKRRKEEEHRSEQRTGCDEQLAEEPSTSTAVPSISPPNEPILKRITRVHATLMARCKFMEMSIRQLSLTEKVRVEHESEDLMLCTWKFMMDCMRMYAVDYFFTASACFPEFEALTMDEKQIMLQSSATRIHILESHWLTMKVFKRDARPLRRCMLTLTTCLDFTNIQFFIQDSNPSPRHEIIVKSMVYYIERLSRIFWPAMEKADLTEIEFHALFGLTVWQFDSCQHLPQRLQEMGEKIRQEIFVDLRRYYREELGLDDYSVRMGNLMALEHTIQEANAVKAEELQTYNLLDMLRADIAFLQIVLQIKL